MPEAPEPTPAERSILMRLAVAEVRAVQAWIATHRADGAETVEPGAESLRRQNTLRNGPNPTVREHVLQQRFAEYYRGLLRAAARGLEPDRQTRHQIYRLLNCAPEETL
jgi:hypothetical protein